MVFAVTPWHFLLSANAAAGVLSNAVAPRHELVAYYANIRFAELMLAHRDHGDELTPARYEALASGSWVPGVGDWLFADALHGADAPRRPAEEAMMREACQAADLEPHLADAIRQMAPAALGTLAEEVLALQPQVVGLSTTFAQTAASLALAGALKVRRPDLPIVFGGSNCDGPMGASLHRNYPQVDYVVRGEADRTLPALLDAITGTDRDRREQELARVPGLCWRRGHQVVVNPEVHHLMPGGQLGSIDQDAFFQALEESPVAEHIRPALILESSRGCWWGQKKHCTFCGLSDSILPYRHKPATEFLSELTGSVSRHQVLDVWTTDDILERTYFTELMPELARIGSDLRIFYEVKANLSADQIAALRAAGVVSVQPGIENLHSLPLKLMDKGTTGTNNVAALRDLQAAGITPYWNYLYGFPGETAEAYETVIRQLPNLVHLMPPDGPDRILLERFNPYFLRPDTGFPTRAPSAWYRIVHPQVSEADLAELAYLFDTDPAGIDDTTAGRLRAAIEAWCRAYPSSQLTHRRVGNQLYLYDRRTTRNHSDLVLDEPDEVFAYELMLRRWVDPARLASSLTEAGRRTDQARAGDLIAAFAEAGIVFTESGRTVAVSVPHDTAVEHWQVDDFVAVAERGTP